MKFDAKTWIIVGLTLGIILLIIFRPAKPIDKNQKKQYDSVVSIWKGLADSAVKQSGAIVKDAFKRMERDSLAINAEKSKTAYWKGQALTKRVLAQPAIDSNAIVKDFVASLDSVIVSQGITIDTLSKAYDRQKESFTQLSKVMVDERKIRELMFTTCSERVAKLQRDYEKEHKRKGVFKKIAGVLGVIALTEAAILAVQ